MPVPMKFRPDTAHKLFVLVSGWPIYFVSVLVSCSNRAVLAHGRHDPVPTYTHRTRRRFFSLARRRLYLKFMKNIGTPIENPHVLETPTYVWGKFQMTHRANVMARNEPVVSNKNCLTTIATGGLGFSVEMANLRSFTSSTLRLRLPIMLNRC
ncbi:unnamed protein product [Linum trigynum]|uniref:Secreted protein n=1 Tax=Linum trigynum TaxID=586398 RepID=A0AAV2EAX6_9ROSI